MRIVSRYSYLFELLEHPVAPVSGERIDARHRFDLSLVEGTGQACPMREQNADVRGVAFDHLDRTSHRHGRWLKHPQVPPCPSSAHEALEQVRAAGDRRQLVAR